MLGMLALRCKPTGNACCGSGSGCTALWSVGGTCSRDRLVEKSEDGDSECLQEEQVLPPSSVVESADDILALGSSHGRAAIRISSEYDCSPSQVSARWS